MSQPSDPMRAGPGGFSQMMETMDVVKQAWSTFNLPTPFAPTLSIEDLDKRIADLRAVEQWVTLNQNMLRNTIQGLEIQRGTLNAVQSLSDSIGNVIKPADELAAQVMAQFAAAAAQQATSPVGAAPVAPPVAPPVTPPLAPPAAPPAKAAAPASAAGFAAPSEGSAAAANPLTWWNLLQDNFRQLAEAATSSANQPPSTGPASPRTPGAGQKPIGEKAAKQATARQAAPRKAAAKKAAPRKAPAKKAPAKKAPATKPASAGPRTSMTEDDHE